MAAQKIGSASVGHLSQILGFVPERLKNEIERMLSLRQGAVFELRLRCGTASSIVISGERIPLSSELDERMLGECVFKLTGGSLYAHRDTLSEGYISLDGGIRVGVAGQARYEQGRLVGVSDIRSLVFRIPSGESSFSDELYEAFKRTETGLLIYSPPGCGKTSSLRALALRLGSGRESLNVAVIDERLEFLPSKYERASVDILRGYKKCDALSIALRALSPDVIIMDEIGGIKEAEGVMQYANSGVKIVATAHAASYSELINKTALRPFFDFAVFDCFVGLSRLKNDFFIAVRSRNA